MISGRGASMICLVLGELWVSCCTGTWHAGTWPRGHLATWGKMGFQVGSGFQGPSMLWEEPGLMNGELVEAECPNCVSRTLTFARSCSLLSVQ